jgi:hypothetical protein
VFEMGGGRKREGRKEGIAHTYGIVHADTADLILTWILYIGWLVVALRLRWRVESLLEWSMVYRG